MRKISLLTGKNIVEIVKRTLNHVDTRLVDHGERVSYIVKKMLETQGGFGKRRSRDLCFLALLHDIGAYKTEEIDRMVQFETGKVWDHSVYGYLFLKNLSPLSKLAPAVLFHHTNYQSLQEKGLPCAELAQLLHIADRVDIHVESRASFPLFPYMEKHRDQTFSSHAIDLFWEAEKQHRILEHLRAKEIDGGVENFLEEDDFSDEEIEGYLNMILFAIDFRSHHTVTHTITTVSISEQLARLFSLGEQQVEKVRCGALLHDLGKIAIPPEILEYPGSLSPQAMKIMQSHVNITGEILADSMDEEVTRISLRHHEKLNGAGYPLGLTGDSLSREERIVAVADIVSALSGTRSYKQSFPKEKTIGILRSMSEQGLICSDVVAKMIGHFDPIMQQVRQNCVPILSAYQNISSEFDQLMEKCSLLDK